MKKINTFANYIYNGKQVVMLYPDDAQRLAPNAQPLSADGSSHPYELTDELITAIHMAMAEEGFLPCVVYEDAYSGWTQQILISILCATKKTRKNSYANGHPIITHPRIKLYESYARPPIDTMIGPVTELKC